MPDAELVAFDNHRAVLTGVTLPSPPPTRITISGNSYVITAPRVALPPLINTVKLILNWIGPSARVAKNIFYVLKGTGSGSTSDPSWLSQVAQGVLDAANASTINQTVHNSWSLASVTARDNGGTSAVGTSTGVPLVGSTSGQCFPPGVAVCVSWKIAEVYRGGKPRTYVPGVPGNAVATAGDSQLTSGFATPMDTNWTAFLSYVNTHAIVGTTVTLGTVSHYTGHAVRPTPQFRAYFDVKVHERIDSQRRRNGRESSFPVTP